MLTTRTLKTLLTSCRIVHYGVQSTLSQQLAHMNINTAENSKEYEALVPSSVRSNRKYNMKYFYKMEWN